MADQLVSRSAAVGHLLHQSDDRLPELRIGKANHDRVVHRLVTFERNLDLLGKYFFAARVDAFGAAPDQRDRSVGIHSGPVTGDDEALPIHRAKRGGSLFRILVIANRLPPADRQQAALAGAGHYVAASLSQHPHAVLGFERSGLRSRPFSRDRSPQRHRFRRAEHIGDCDVRHVPEDAFLDVGAEYHTAGHYRAQR